MTLPNLRSHSNPDNCFSSASISSFSPSTSEYSELDDKTNGTSRTVFDSEHSTPKGEIHLSKSPVLPPDTAEIFVTQQLHIPKTSLKAEQKYNKEISAHQFYKVVVGQIRREGQAGTLKDRLHLKATVQESGNAIGRILKKYPGSCADFFELQNLEKSKNPVAKLSEASFVPLAAFSTLLDKQIQWQVAIQSSDSFLEDYIKMKDAIMDENLKDSLEESISCLRNRINILLNCRNTNDEEEFYRQLLGTDFTSDLGKCFRINFLKALESFVSDIEKLQSSKDPAIQKMIAKAKKDQSDLAIKTFASRVKERLNSLFKREELISALRLMTLQITTLPTDLVILAKQDSEWNEWLKLLELRKSDKYTLQQRISKINSRQEKARQSIQELIFKLDLISSSYVETTFFDDLIKTVQGVSAYILRKDQRLLKTKNSTQLEEIDLSEKLKQQFETTNQHISCKEVLHPHLGSAEQARLPQREEFLTDLISSYFEETAKYLPISRVQNYFRLSRADEPTLENVIFGSFDNAPQGGQKSPKDTVPVGYVKKFPYYYHKDDVLVQIKKALWLGENPENLMFAFKKVVKHPNIYLTQQDLESILRSCNSEVWHVLKALTAYGLAEDIVKVTKNVSTQNALKAAIAKVKMEMAGPVSFSFKLGVENSRELLMNALLPSFGSIGRFILPKFSVTLKDASFNNQLHPTGIATGWKTGKAVDYEAASKYHAAKKEAERYQHYAVIIKEEESLEKKLSDLKQTMNLSPDQIKYRTGLEASLTFISVAKKIMANKPLDVVLQKLKEARDAFCTSESQESIGSTGIIDMLLGSEDSHGGQFVVDSNGTYYNVDSARFGLPSPVYQQSTQTFTCLRSFCLDHPFALEKLPETLVQQVLALNVEDIEKEWRLKELIGNDAFFMRHNIFKSLGAIRRLFAHKQLVEESTDHDELRDAVNGVLELNQSSANLAHDKSTIVNYLLAQIRNIAEKEKQLIEEIRLSLIKASATQDASTPQVPLDSTLAQVKAAKTYDDFEKIKPGFFMSFLEKQATRERAQREQELCFSKLSESAFKQFKDKFIIFQKYLSEKGDKATLREATELVYPHLKPFLRAYERIKGEPFENLSLKTIQIDDATHFKHASLEDCIEMVEKNRNFFSDEEFNELIKMYDDIKNGKIKGITVGKKSDNAIAR